MSKKCADTNFKTEKKPKQRSLVSENYGISTFQQEIISQMDLSQSHFVFVFVFSCRIFNI